MDLVERHPGVVTVEENALTGGFGSAVLETMQARGVTRPMLRFGLPDRFVAHGTPGQLQRMVGLTASSIAAETLNLVRVSARS